MNTALIEQLEIRDKYIAELRAENEYLRDELEHWKEAAQTGFEANEILVARISKIDAAEKARASNI